ncbi:MAG: hypothetical protein KDB48_02495 [Solirubrobacterales bacterium]|nr:hypothetical protein [Solirubrobacterales bacterium]HMT03973.1 hypothetical protein [Solirubrobacterales bacterium]
MLRKAATMSLLVAILIVAGCGGSEEPVSQEDTAAITTLVGELNRVTADRDADGFCELMQPTQMEATFHTLKRCIKETQAILDQAGDQPTLEIESMEVDGDTAMVVFTGAAGRELELVRENGFWYIPFTTDDNGDSASPESQAGTE